MTVKRNWIIKESKPDFEYRAYRDFKVSEIVARILHNRGIDNYDKACNYLNPSIKNIHDPFLLPNMEEASDRISFAIKNGEKILLFGDYDVDGITGSSILYKALSSLGANVQAYVPNRFKDGYGISPDPLKRVFDSDGQPSVIISIDNGIVAFDASEFLKSKNIDFIVADHHRMSEDGTLPEAILVHPDIPNSKYPNKHLCGAGVAFKLAWGAAQKACKTNKLPPKYRDLFKDLTSLVAMGTIADIMPLTQENRDLVAYGLKQINTNGLRGLRGLVSESVKDPDSPVKAGQVAFQIAPRINATGRLGSGQKAFNLLTSMSATESEDLASSLTKDNNLRKEIEASIVESAFSQVVKVYGENPVSAGIIVYDDGWHEGVVGIVASRVVEKFGRPSIVLSVLEDGVNVKGSGRGALGVDMKDALDECEDLLSKYGGHGAAVGLSTKMEHLPELRKRFALACAKQLGFDRPEVPEVVENFKIDSEILLKQINYRLLDELSLLEPCGMGNRRPVFSTTVKLAGMPKLIGEKKNHLNFSVEQDGIIMRCVYWSALDQFPKLERLANSPVRQPFRIAFKPEMNTFRGKRSIQLMITNILLPEEE